MTWTNLLHEVDRIYDVTSNQEIFIEEMQVVLKADTLIKMND
jgi:hypothetical protein